MVPSLFFAFVLDWSRILPAALVLIFPLPLLFTKRTQYRELDSNWSKYLTQGITYPWHWFDAVRAFMGTRWLLMILAIGPPDYIAHRYAFVSLGVVLVAAIIAQTVVCKAPEGFHAPFGFVAGVIIAILPPVPAALTLVSAFVVTLATRSGATFFAAAAVFSGIFGAVFFRKFMLLPSAIAVAGLPLLLPLLFQRHLVLAHRRVDEKLEDHGPLR